MVSENLIVESIKEVARNVQPENARLLLYGSRARGDYGENTIGTCLSYWISQR